MPDKEIQEIVELPTLEDELRRHKKLIEQRAWKYFPANHLKPQREDCVQKTAYSITRHHKNVKKGSEIHEWPIRSPMVWRYVRWAALNIFKEQKRHKYKDIDDIPEPKTKSQKYDPIKDIANTIYDSTDRHIFIRRAKYGCTYQEVGDELNITREAVHYRVRNHIRPIVRKYLEEK